MDNYLRVILAFVNYGSIENNSSKNTFVVCASSNDSDLPVHSRIAVWSAYSRAHFYNRKMQCFLMWTAMTAQLALYVNLHRAVIGPSATLTGRWRPDIDLRRMLTGCSDCMNAQSDLSIRRANMSEGRFLHIVAQISTVKVYLMIVEPYLAIKKVERMAVFYNMRISFHTRNHSLSAKLN